MDPLELDFDFEEGDFLKPTAHCGGEEYHPELEMQKVVIGSPSQQFYVEDNTTIVSLMCTDLVVSIPDDEYCQQSNSNITNGTSIRLEERGTDGSAWLFNGDDSSIESDLCSGQIFDIKVTATSNGADLRASIGNSLILSSSAKYKRWEMTPRKYTTTSAPLSIINPSNGEAIGVATGQCTNEIALEVQTDDAHNQDQQFFLGKKGMIHSQKCHGLVFAVNGCSDGEQITLKPPTDDEHTQWAFSTDGSVYNKMCGEGMVIDFDDSDIIIMLKTKDTSADSQLWTKVSARLLAADVLEDYVQNWTVEFVDEYNGTLPSHSTTSNRLLKSKNDGVSDDTESPSLYPPHEGFSGSFEDFAKDLVIDDASDEDQCRNARELLGYDRDYPFDTEVRDTFNDYMCDGEVFTEADHLSEGLSRPPEFIEVVFEAPE